MINEYMKNLATPLEKIGEMRFIGSRKKEDFLILALISLLNARPIVGLFLHHSY